MSWFFYRYFIKGPIPNIFQYIGYSYILRRFVLFYCNLFFCTPSRIYRYVITGTLKYAYLYHEEW